MFTCFLLVVDGGFNNDGSRSEFYRDGVMITFKTKKECLTLSDH